MNLNINPETPVSLALTKMNIPHRVFPHTGPLRSVAQAAAERNQVPEQVVRSILFRVAKGEYVMILMAGPAQISWKALRRYIGQSRLTMAKPDEVLTVTGYERGAVAPFGLPQPLRIIADESVFCYDEISMGSGIKGTGIIMTQPDFQRALGDIERGNFLEQSTDG